MHTQAIQGKEWYFLFAMFWGYTFPQVKCSKSIRPILLAINLNVAEKQLQFETKICQGNILKHKASLMKNKNYSRRHHHQQHFFYLCPQWFPSLSRALAPYSLSEELYQDPAGNIMRQCFGRTFEQQFVNAHISNQFSRISKRHN